VFIVSVLIISFINYRQLASSVKTKTNANMEIFADSILAQIRHLNIILDATKQTLNEKHIAIAKTVMDILDSTPGQLSTEKLLRIAQPLDIIDHFKKYNDAYGHDAGDECLGIVAAALSQCIIRDEDFVARYGGEEFAVVLPNADENGARMVAEKMLKKVRDHNITHHTSDTAFHVTVSIGGTTGIINHLQHGSDYIKAADKALYESKRNGRNRYTFMKIA